MNKSQETEVLRILYKQVLEGDLKKIKAKSNTTKSGGGARDFRFGNYSKTHIYLERMFSEKVDVERKRAGKHGPANALKGTLCWKDKDGNINSQDVQVEVPTDSRGAESRISRIHEIACFDTSLIPKGGPDNRVFLMFIQIADGTIWPRYVEEKSLRTDPWKKEVANELLTCIDAKRDPRYAIAGFIDLVEGDRYCNGK